MSYSFNTHIMPSGECTLMTCALIFLALLFFGDFWYCRLIAYEVAGELSFPAGTWVRLIPRVFTVEATLKSKHFYIHIILLQLLLTIMYFLYSIYKTNTAKPLNLSFQWGTFCITWKPTKQVSARLSTSANHKTPHPSLACQPPPFPSEPSRPATSLMATNAVQKVAWGTTDG
jgi:hypothetical protein